MSRIFFVFAPLLLGVHLFAVNARAAEGTGIVFQTVANHFVPKETFVLLESNSGKILKFVAVAIRRTEAEEDEEKRIRLLLGAAVPYSSLSEKTHFSFFLEGENGEFSATPVNVLTAESLLDSKKRISEIETAKAVLERDRVSLQDAVAEWDEKLSVLQDQASQVAGLDEIVDIKVELSGLKGIGQESEAETERLRALIAQGRKQREPADIKETLKELSTHLKETAQVTAMADRLNQRRRSAARETLNSKIALIQEMRAVDTEQVAKDILRLRRKRRQLELQLGIGGANNSNQF